MPKAKSTPVPDSRALRRWLFAMAGVVAFLVVFGGFVRLMRAGLSIVEWNVIGGVLPPLNEQQWQDEFAKYQQSPEFLKMNADMTLAGYKRIFLIEWFHRLVARLAGLSYVIPLVTFLARGDIPWKRSWVYLAGGLLFAFQGYMGWYMVSSGLVDNPYVSPYRLTAHLLLALLLLALCLWQGLSLKYPPASQAEAGKTAGWTARWLVWLALAILVLQMSYGGLTAGLKAGYITATFPLMYGRWIPPGMLSTLEPWFVNLVQAPITVHFIHRWLGFVVLALALAVYQLAARRELGRQIQRLALWLLALVSLQIILGVSVVIFHVPPVLALLHQANALGLFAITITLGYRMKAGPLGLR